MDGDKLNVTYHSRKLYLERMSSDRSNNDRVETEDYVHELKVQGTRAQESSKLMFAPGKKGSKKMELNLNSSVFNPIGTLPQIVFKTSSNELIHLLDDEARVQESRNTVYRQTHDARSP